MFKISTKYHFDSAHFLPGYKGKCANLHGHTWTIRVTIAGDKLNLTGILVDFKEVKEKLKQQCEYLDHKVLNNVLPATIKPTAEGIAEWLFYDFNDFLFHHYHKVAWIDNIRVYESPESYAEYSDGIQRRK